MIDSQSSPNQVPIRIVSDAVREFANLHGFAAFLGIALCVLIGPGAFLSPVALQIVISGSGIAVICFSIRQGILKGSRVSFWAALCLHSIGIICVLVELGMEFGLSGSVGLAQLVVTTLLVLFAGLVLFKLTRSEITEWFFPSEKCQSDIVREMPIHTPDVNLPD